MAMDHKKKALEMLTQIAGGGLAGVLDVQFSQTLPLGLPIGAVAGAALTGVGLYAAMKGQSGGFMGRAGELGVGMLCGEAAFAAADRMAKMKAAAPQQAAGVAGLYGSQVAGSLPSNRPVISRQDLQAQFAHMARQAA